MFVSSWFPWRTVARQQMGRSRPSHSSRARRRGTRLGFEPLEGRTLLASWTAVSVADLIADINAANLAGGSNTITLAAHKTFNLTAVNNTTDGANGLPVIAAKNNLTIKGNGDTVARSTASGTPNFRLFDVALGAMLRLENVTLQGGSAYGVGAKGGAILNQGALTLNAVTVTGNSSQATSNILRPTCSLAAAGGGIYSTGSLTLEAGTVVTSNSAVGARGVSTSQNLNGGPGLGGGVYVAGGTAALTNVTLSSNIAYGGAGCGGTYSGNGGGWTSPAGNGGAGYGGAVYVAGGIVTLRSVTVTRNCAIGGAGGSPRGLAGAAQGGGLYFAAAATVSLDPFTFSHATGNRPNNIYGAYTIVA
jgi:hypothetical protein